MKASAGKLVWTLVAGLVASPAFAAAVGCGIEGAPACQVPEPSSLMLMGLGAAAIVATRLVRRR
jgi:hypothetical protein